MSDHDYDSEENKYNDMRIIKDNRLRILRHKLDLAIETLEAIDQWDWGEILRNVECDKEVYDELENVSNVLTVLKR